MKHEEIRHALSDFIDGVVTPGERADIEQHLKICSECADALRELRKTLEHVRAIGEVESPPWMTQKIMAKVQDEHEEKQRLWPRVFAPFFTLFPVQAVAVLFLAVTAYYMYSSIDPVQKYTEEPVGMLAKKEAPAVQPMKDGDKAVLETVPKAKQGSHKPGYKSLDMKYAYEKPPAPAPQDRPAVSAPTPAKREAFVSAQDVADRGKQDSAPSAAAQSLMAEQAAPSAGAVRQTEGARADLSEERKAQKVHDADREADALLNVTEHFVKVDLAENLKKKGLQYHTRKFGPDSADLVWMRDTGAFRANPCTNRYVVDVDHAGMLEKYLYCYDQSRIRLLGIYELRQGNWSEKQR